MAKGEGLTYVIELAELADGRLTIGGTWDGTTWLEWLRRVAAAVEREMAEQELGVWFVPHCLLPGVEGLSGHVASR